MYKNKGDSRENQRKRRKELGDKYINGYKERNKNNRHSERIRCPQRYDKISRGEVK